MLLAAACGGPSEGQRCDGAAFRSVQLAHARRAEVTVCGTVTAVGRLRRSQSGIHRVFVIDAGGNDLVHVDANVDIMGNFPIRLGQHAIVRGEYYSDPDGRDGIHWTHRTDRGTHAAGYVQLDGTIYN